MYDAIIIGGGFYGSAIAAYLAQQRGLSQIMLIEKESTLFSQASYHNQARVHNGYHYPRSFVTGFRSRINLPRFIRDYVDCVNQNFTMLYAIARKNSKVTAKQFQRFCKEIDADLRPAPEQFKKLFIPNFIEDVFLVEEHVFNAQKLREHLQQQLQHHQVKIVLNTKVKNIAYSLADKALQISGADYARNGVSFRARLVFNCSYSGLNQFGGDFVTTAASLKHELAEMALIQMPAELAQVGITVMDGPFFSLMPFPPEGLHTLSHVRYTPHFSWSDQVGIDPYEKIQNDGLQTKFDRMTRDVSRYLPSILQAQYRKSLFTVKTTLLQNENNDGRPILFEKSATLPGLYSILGGKIDNIYDILEKLDAESW